MIAFPRYHRLACRESVSISELRDETFLLDYDIINQKIRNEDTAHRGLLLSCLRACFTPKVVYLNVAGSNLVNIRDVAIMENSWIYQTFSLKSLHNDNNIFIPLSEPQYYAQYYFVTMMPSAPKTTIRFANASANLQINNNTIINNIIKILKCRQDVVVRTHHPCLFCGR